MRWLAVLCFFCIAGTAFAQTVNVRTGEHGEFTRLVADFPKVAQYEVTREGRVLTLETGYDGTFLLDGVFDRIDRSRIRSVRSDEPGQLTVELACDCGFETLQQGNGWVILDISDNEPDGTVGTDSAEADRLATRLLGPRRAERQTPILPGKLATLIDRDEEYPTLQERTSAARDQLARQFARGVSQGVVQATKVPSYDEEVTEVEVEDVPPPPPPQIETSPQLSVQTQVDRDAELSGFRKRSGTECLPEEAFEFSEWGDERSPFRGVKQARADLYDDAGRIVEDAVVAYAKAAIFATLFEEAGAALRESGFETEEGAILQAIVSALNPSGEVGALADQIDCDSNAALVAFASADGPAVSNPNIVLRRLADLPNPLRDYLAPKIAERFLEFGMIEEAELARNDYDRGTPSDAEEAAFVAARLEAPDDGETSPLVEVVADRAPRAAEAMIFLLTSQIARGEPPSLSIIEQASALSFEVSDPDRAELDRAILRALNARGDFGAALEEIDRLRSLGRGPFDDLEADFLQAVVGIENDAVFLERAVLAVGRPIADAETRTAIATRLFDLGLVAQAGEIIDLSDQVPTRTERILRARIALQAGKSDIARSYLAGLEGEDVAPVRRLLEPEAAPPSTPEPSSQAEEVVRRAEFSRASRSLSESAALREEFSAFLNE